MDYAVCWDGSHRGQDCDLLVADRIPEKRQPSPTLIPSGRRVTRADVQAALVPYLEIGNVTLRELCAFTGYQERTVRRVLASWPGVTSRKSEAGFGTLAYRLAR